MKIDPAIMRRLLQPPCTIAVVGLSANPQRPSFGVARYMQQHGFRIVPVNPRYGAAGESILGEPCYASLVEIAFAVDIVDVFRRSEDVLPIAGQAVRIGAKCLWQQIGVENLQADEMARAAGLISVMNLCIKIEHARLLGTGQSG